MRCPSGCPKPAKLAIKESTQGVRRSHKRTELGKGEIPRLKQGIKNGEVSEWLPQASEAGDKGEHAWRATQPQSTELEKGEIPRLKQGIKKR